MPTVDDVHETVAVPNPVMVAGVIVPQLTPDGTTSLSVTVPVKWLIEDIVIVVVVEEPTFAGGVAAVIVKSTTCMDTWTVCVRFPLVAVTVAV